MKKLFILALGAIAMVSCGNSYKAQDAVLSNSVDSVNYALGLLNGQQLYMQTLSTLDEKEAKTAITEFMNALQRGWDGKVEEVDEITGIAQNIAYGVKDFEEKGLAGNEAWTLNEKLFWQGVVNGMYNDTTAMTAVEARQYFQNAYMASHNDTTAQRGKTIKSSCPKKAKAVALKTKEDSLNYAFGLLNGSDVLTYVISGDTTGKARETFVKVANKTLKDKTNYPQLVQMAENIGKTILQQSETGLIGVPGLETKFELIKQGFVNGMSEYGDWETAAASAYIQETIDNIRFGESKKASEQFLEENKLNEGVIVTESGLQYMVLKEGKGAKPAATDRVRVHYHGTLIDGTVFDSSVERGETIVFGLNQVIPGWTEGLQLMSVGSKYRFFIPQELAYGSRQAGQIPPYSTLIFDVELFEINPKEK